MKVNLSKKATNLVIFLLVGSVTASILISIYHHSLLNLIPAVLLFVAILVIGIKREPEIIVIGEEDL